MLVDDVVTGGISSAGYIFTNIRSNHTIAASFVANTTTVPPPSTPTITITSPTFNVVWVSDQGHTVTWSTAGVGSGTTLTMELLTPSNGSVSGFNAFTTANDGSESFSLASVAPGFYYFRLKAIINGQPIYGGSGVFQLVASLATNPPLTSTTYAIYATTAGSGSGTITKSPNQTNYAAGASVTLTATPSSGSTFSGWIFGSGSISSTANPTTVTMNADKSVTAVFAVVTTPLPPATMRGFRVGVTNQATNSALAGATVEITRQSDNVVVLTQTTGTDGYTPAVPLRLETHILRLSKTGFLPRSISLSIPTGSGTYTYGPMPMTPETTTPPPPTTYTISTQVTSATTGTLGSGTITKSPNQTSYTAGTVVTLTATPAPGSTFVGWSGNCSGTSCTLTMNGNKSVTAIFAGAQTTTATYSISATTAGSGSGTITKSPNQTSYNSGTSVTLTATPSSGSTFSGWIFGSGSISSTANPTTVTMNADKSVTAVFAGTATTPPPTTSQVMKFRITDRVTGTAIAGALVNVSSGGHVSTLGPTDANGYSSAVTLPVGAAYSMSSAKTGYQTRSISSTVPNWSPTATYILTFTLSR